MIRPLLWALLLMVATAAIANDSTAELGVGGLRFVQNDQVEMASEDLFISLDEVRVRYEFVNRGAADWTGLVAFPLPPIGGPLEMESEIGLPDREAANFVDFSTTADGRPVHQQMEQKVFAFGVDRTQLLAEAGVPLSPYSRAAQDALEKMPDRWDEFARLGLVRIEEYDDTGQGMRRHPQPIWTLHTVFYWQQSFAAGKTTIVAHRYRPSVGGTVAVSFGSKASRGEPWFAEMRSKYCIENSFIAAVDKALKTGKDGQENLYESRIDYILKTGNNWAGPIGTFRLTIDKGAPTNLVSFCGSGVRKTGPTTFEMSRADFYPERDLSILFIRTR
jgi:hypothetical protein